MNKTIVCASFLLAAFAVSAGPREAFACGPTPTLNEPLVPLADSVDVPLNTALIGAGNFSAVTFSLREVQGKADPAAALDARANTDAGLPLLDVEVTCHGAPEGGSDGGALCVGVPALPLSPSTTYEWLVQGAGPEQYQMGESDWMRFTTGTESKGPPKQTDKLTLVLKEHVVIPNHPCGTRSNSLFEFQGGSGDFPLVANLAAFIPSYVMLPVVHTPGTNTELRAYNIPDCVTGEYYDFTGARHEINQVCTEDFPDLITEAPSDSPATTDADPAAPPRLNPVDPSSEKPSDSSASCALQPMNRSSSSFAVWALLALSVVFRRKRL